MVLETMFMSLWTSFVASLPGLILAIVILIIGLVVGKVIGWVVKEILMKLRIDEYVLEEEKPALRLSDIFSVIARWWIYLIFIEQATLFLGVAAITSAVNEIVAFLPNAIMAALIIIVGYVVAEYIKDRILTSKTFYGSITGKVIFFLVILIAVSMALSKLTVDTMLFNYIMLILVGSFGLGAAIAMGWGLKDIVAKEAERYAKKR